MSMAPRAVEALQERFQERAAGRFNQLEMELAILEIEAQGAGENYPTRKFIRALRAGAFDKLIDRAINKLISGR